MNGKVNVLLATYNGAQYLEEQLQSILNQKQQQIILHIRDDGSEDSTKSILEAYTKSYSEIRVTYGPNLGVFASFYELLKEADVNCDYFAFSDQDDVWQQDKIARAAQLLAIEEQDIPLLYCSKVEFVDSELKFIGFSKTPAKIGFGNALVENIAPGCTIVINKKARELLLSASPQAVFMHDWWFYLVISAFGQIIYDENSLIKYRQHRGNAVGGSPNTFIKFYRRIKRFLQVNENTYEIWKQAQQLMWCYGDKLDIKNQTILNRFLNSKSNLLNRIGYAVTMDVWRQSYFDSIILRVLILFGYY